jgi:hypothetical protein
MARAHLRQRLQIYGVASSSGDMGKLVEVLTATTEENVTLGSGARVHAGGSGDDAILLLPAEGVDGAGLAAFAVALTAGARRAELEAHKEVRTA